MPFFVKARIVHVQYENDKGYYNMGLEFKQLPPNFATMLYEELKEVESYKSRLSYGRETPVSLREAAATYYEQNQ
jgi:hypothetical protein